MKPDERRFSDAVFNGWVISHESTTYSFKYNTKRSIEPKDWDFKKGRPRNIRGNGGKRNQEVNIILNEYRTAVQRIKDLYGGALTADKLKNL